MVKRGGSVRESFHKLPGSLQHAIRNAGYQVFTEESFQQASTNRIVSLAGISKGTLFYHFQSKKSFYYYLIDYALAFIEKNYIQRIRRLERSDFITRYRDVAAIKQEAMEKEPFVFTFLGTLHLKRPREIPSEQKKRMQKLMQESEDILTTDIDTSMLREDIDSGPLLRYMHYVMEGYRNELVNRYRRHNLTKADFQKDFEDYERFLQHMKTLFYQ